MRFRTFGVVPGVEGEESVRVVREGEHMHLIPQHHDQSVKTIKVNNQGQQSRSTIKVNVH